MSSPVATKTKTLAAKHAKFIQYGFHLIKHMAALDSSIDADRLHTLARTFADPISQHELVEHFLSNSKAVSAEMKNIIAQHKTDAKNALKLAAKNERAATKAANKASNKKSKKAPVQDDRRQ